jgi:hypothetical protein
MTQNLQVPKFEIDWDAADNITVTNLRNSIESVEKCIKELKKTKNKTDAQKRDQDEQIVILDALKQVYDYYGGNLK